MCSVVPLGGQGPRLRTPGPDATDRWFAFLMYVARFDIYRPQVNFLL